MLCLPAPTATQARGNCALPVTPDVIALGDGQTVLLGEFETIELLPAREGKASEGIELFRCADGLFVGVHGSEEGITSLLTLDDNGTDTGKGGRTVKLETLATLLGQASIRFAGFFCCYASAVSQAQSGHRILFARTNCTVRAYRTRGVLCTIS